MTSLLKVEGLRRSFGGVIALRDARFEFEAGAVCALANLTELSPHFVVDVSREAKASREAIERFQIRVDRDVESRRQPLSPQTAESRAGEKVSA